MARKLASPLAIGARRNRPCRSRRARPSTSPRAARPPRRGPCARRREARGRCASMTPSSRQWAGIRLERRGGLLRLAGVAPEDRRAALGRDDGVDRVLLHEHAVGNGDRDRAARAALADDAGDARDAEPRHRELAARDPASLPVLLGGDARIGARSVDERDDRESGGGRPAPSRASPCGSPRDTSCRSSGACARGCPGPSDGRRARPCGRRSAPRPATIAGSSAKARSPCSSTKSSHMRSM